MRVVGCDFLIDKCLDRFRVDLRELNFAKERNEVLAQIHLIPACVVPFCVGILSSRYFFTNPPAP